MNLQQGQIKVPGFPRWVAHAEIGSGVRVGENLRVPIHVTVHRRRAMLWALLTGRVRFGRRQ